MAPLTDRQQQCLEFIKESLRTRGIPPTMREIGDHMGIRSTNGVSEHLRALERKGYIKREPGVYRSIVVVGMLVTGQAEEVDLYDESGEVLYKVTVDRVLLGIPEADRVFALRTKDGVISIVKRQESALAPALVVIRTHGNRLHLKQWSHRFRDPCVGRVISQIRRIDLPHYGT